MRSIFDCDRISSRNWPPKSATVGRPCFRTSKQLMEMGLVQEVGTLNRPAAARPKALRRCGTPLCGRSGDHTGNHYRRSAAGCPAELVRFEAEKASFERSDTYAAMLAELVQSLLAKRIVRRKNPRRWHFPAGYSGRRGTNKRWFYSHALGLRNVPLEEFSRHIPFPCRFINDANAAGLADSRSTIPRSVTLSVVEQQCRRCDFQPVVRMAKSICAPVNLII